MAGLLTHLIICLVGFVLAWVILKSWKYGALFVLGQLIPDLISFGIPGIKIGSADPMVIMSEQLFSNLALFTHNAFHWIIFAVIAWVIALLLYSFKKIGKEKFANSILAIVCFITGVVLHLIIDKLIIEKSYWI
jgi:hypothetical protein